jgi:phytoene dehydrogenase-like protein
MESIEFWDADIQMHYVSKNGESLTLYNDLERLEAELHEKAPADAAFTRTFLKTVRKFMGFRMPLHVGPEVMSPWDKLKVGIKVLPYMPGILKYGKIPVREIGERCKTPLLRESFTHNLLFNRCAFFSLIMSMAFAAKRSAGYPIGGSLPLARRFEEAYRRRGGRVHYRSKVARIAVENDAAKGIELEGGDVHPADLVVSAADGHDTIFGMLGGRYTGDRIENLYAGKHKVLTVFPSLVYVSLGVGRAMDDVPHRVSYLIDEPLAVDDRTEHKALSATVYNFDPTLAPEGKTCVNVMFESFGYEHWAALRETDRETYEAEKKRIADRIVDVLDEKMGNIRDRVEVIDVATPATFHRFTNNWRGSYEGWLPAPGAMLSRISKTLPGLGDFYHIGQWVEPGGGLPNCIRSGRDVTQMICKAHGNRFTGKG